MNQRDFLGESVCLCEMFTNASCLNSKRLEINVFICLLGGTKRNWFNLEERLFCLDVRKIFVTHREAKACIRTMCH